MVRNHVAQRAGRLVEIAAFFDADRLGHGDLNVVDAFTVPDRLEKPVGEAERHDALYGVLAQEVVDAEDLVLAQRTQDAGVQLSRGFDAVAKRLFDDHATPMAPVTSDITFIGETGLAQVIDNIAEATGPQRRDRK